MNPSDKTRQPKRVKAFTCMPMRQEKAPSLQPSLGSVARLAAIHDLAEIVRSHSVYSAPKPHLPNPYKSLVLSGASGWHGLKMAEDSPLGAQAAEEPLADFLKERSDRGPVLLPSLDLIGPSPATGGLTGIAAMQQHYQAPKPRLPLHYKPQRHVNALEPFARRPEERAEHKPAATRFGQ